MTETPADTQAARLQRREPLLVLLSRMQRGVLLEQERDLLRAAVETELRDGDMAHEQAAEARARRFSTHDLDICARDRERDRQFLTEARRLRDEACGALNTHRVDLACTLGQRIDLDWPVLLDQVRTIRAAAIERRDLLEAARERAEHAEAFRDAVYEALGIEDGQLPDTAISAIRGRAVNIREQAQRAERAERRAQALARAGREEERRRRDAEDTLAAVRKAVADAKACGGEDAGCTVDHRDIITAIIDGTTPPKPGDRLTAEQHAAATAELAPGTPVTADAVRNALGEQPAEPEPVCPGCGHHDGEGCGCPPPESLRIPEQAARDLYNALGKLLGETT